ncbi:MAG: NADH-quinone oxidoreductase subunit NuoH [Candidatus Nezhaarchaeales archaeon]
MLMDILAFLTSPRFIEAFLRVIVFPGTLFTLLYAILAVWGERKLHARVHLRIGPLHIGPIMGLFQVIADFVKLVQKEIIVPRAAHRFIYNFVPLAAPILAAMSFAFIPCAPYPFYYGRPGPPYWVIYYTDLSLLVVLALFSLRPLLMIGAGWASNNKYSTLGALRAALQLFAYEVPLIIALAGIVIAVGTFDLARIAESQLVVWFILTQPLGFIVALIAMMAELGRRPFDIPLAEQEVVFGWPTEYTGAQFALVMMSEYLDLCAVSALITILYLGGWYGPVVPFLPPQASYVFWFLFKVAVLTIIIMLGRAVFPRLRIDQLLKAGWTWLIPLALLQVIIVLLEVDANMSWCIPAIAG